ncbi:MAG: hypothetical protein ACU84H_15440 [Gammaproteobacteria bacterium]
MVDSSSEKRRQPDALKVYGWTAQGGIVRLYPEGPVAESQFDRLAVDQR